MEAEIRHWQIAARGRAVYLKIRGKSMFKPLIQTPTLRVSTLGSHLWSTQCS